MFKLIQSHWIAMIIGDLLYVGTLYFGLNGQPLQPPEITEETPARIDTSWEFQNPEADQLVDELKARKTAFEQREAELKEWETRLSAERAELSVITKSVQQIQDKFDQNVLRLREAEAVSLKKLAKTYSTMEPDRAASMLKVMDTDTAAKILRTMKESESALIFEALSKNPADSKRGAEITERMRVALGEATVPTTQKNP